MSHEQNAGQFATKRWLINSLKMWYSSNTCKLFQQMKTACLKNYKQTEFGECMLLFSPDVLSSHLLPRNIKTKIHTTTIFPVLYGSETRSLTFRKEYRMRTLENKVLRKVCKPNRESVIRKWRKTYNERLHCNLYS
jgi:hypothetical protein